MGRVLTFPSRSAGSIHEGPTVEDVLADLERLLDSPADLTRRSGAILRGTATPARELLAPIWGNRS